MYSVTRPQTSRPRNRDLGIEPLEDTKVDPLAADLGALRALGKVDFEVNAYVEGAYPNANSTRVTRV